ncbi:MAG TPA: NifB/NifX family molybdenum-iron cluster-binding protein [Bacteroidales bacterium]|nr:NifB/NifX family molybdenum-iron cluster-binding protein [Bacteroidales bacterium]
MKVAVPTRNGQVDDHFGHCEYYTIFTIENGKVEKEETMKSPEGCGCKSNVAPMLAQMGVGVMLAGNMGMGALGVLNYNGIEVFRGCSGDVHDLIKAYLEETITDSGESCHSHENCQNNH